MNGEKCSWERKMTYHDLIYHKYGWLVLVLVVVSAIYAALARRSNIEKRLKRQPNFTADDWLFSVSGGTGVAIDMGRKVFLLADDRANRLYQAQDLIGCEVLSDNLQLSGLPQAAIILRILVNDVHRPQYDVVLLERSFFEKMGLRIRADDRVTRQAFQTAQEWHEKILTLIRTVDASEAGRGATSSATGTPTSIPS
jgi:hypothetical protein